MQVINRHYETISEETILESLSQLNFSSIKIELFELKQLQMRKKGAGHYRACAEFAINEEDYSFEVVVTDSQLYDQIQDEDMHYYDAPFSQLFETIFSYSVAIVEEVEEEYELNNESLNGEA